MIGQAGRRPNEAIFNAGYVRIRRGIDLRVLIGCNLASVRHTVSERARSCDLLAENHSSTGCGASDAQGASVTTSPRPFRLRHR